MVLSKISKYSSTLTSGKTVVIVGSLLIGIAGGYYYYKRYCAATKQSQERPLTFWIDSLVNTCCKHEAILVESPEQWFSASLHLQSDLDQLMVIGLDCEWVTVDRKRKPISMLQVSTLNHTVLVRLHKLGFIPDGLATILKDRKVIKVGVGIIEDADKLWSDYHLQVHSSVDLRHVAARQKKSWVGAGLKTLSQEVVGLSLDKSDLLRRGNWEAEPLPISMTKYAAQDSQAGIAIYIKLVGMKMTRAAPTNSKTKALEAIQMRARSLCQGITDLSYKQNSMTRSATAESNVKAPKQVPTKSISANALRQRVMYSNCEMQAPDGQILCVCDVRKAEWYIEKELAVRISEPDDDKLVIRLKFEPKGRPSGERDYYRAEKENICVVCGTDTSFIRKNIVPREYRRHFPEILKSHSSHDVVLLCSACHKKTTTYDQSFKSHLAELCNAPFKSGAIKIDEEMKKVKSAARALNGYRDKIPEKKLNDYAHLLCQFYGTDELSDDIIQQACSIDERAPDSGDHGQKVVQYFDKNTSVQEFQKLWRQRFVDLMEPKYLGEFWHVDYDHMDYKWAKPDFSVGNNIDED